MQLLLRWWLLDRLHEAEELVVDLHVICRCRLRVRCIRIRLRLRSIGGRACIVLEQPLVRILLLGCAAR